MQTLIFCVGVCPPGVRFSSLGLLVLNPNFCGLPFGGLRPASLGCDLWVYSLPIWISINPNFWPAPVEVSWSWRVLLFFTMSVLIVAIWYCVSWRPFAIEIWSCVWAGLKFCIFDDCCVWYMLLLLCMIYDNEFCYANQDDVYLALVHLGIEDMCFLLSRALTLSWNCTSAEHDEGSTSHR